MQSIRRFVFIIAGILAQFISSGVSEAACDHHSRSGSENTLPILRFAFSPEICPCNSALYLLGEVGDKNFRANATYGFFWDGCHRFKFGGEWLAQKLKYNFSSGATHRWVYQGAIGFDYEYFVNCGLVNAIDFSFDYAHASNKHLRPVDCEESHHIIYRRISGSDDYHASFGFNITPWCDARLHVSGDYDYLRYADKFHSRRRITQGLGGTAAFYQRWGCFDFNLKGEFRRPYTYYEGQLNWNTCFDCGYLTFGIFGNHTRGREHLPSETAFGIQVGADFGFRYYTVTYDHSECDYYNCCPRQCKCYYDCDLAHWITEPAVYYPLVLAIAEERRRDTCVQPTSTAISDIFIDLGSQDPTTTFDASVYFNPNGGPAFTYSISVTPNHAGAPYASVSINPSTGVVTIVPIENQDPELLTITITATNECGSTSQTFQADLDYTA